MLDCSFVVHRCDFEQMVELCDLIEYESRGLVCPGSDTGCVIQVAPWVVDRVLSSCRLIQCGCTFGNKYTGLSMCVMLLVVVAVVVALDQTAEFVIVCRIVVTLLESSIGIVVRLVLECDTGVTVYQILLRRLR